MIYINIFLQSIHLLVKFVRHQVFFILKRLMGMHCKWRLLPWIRNITRAFHCYYALFVSNVRFCNGTETKLNRWMFSGVAFKLWMSVLRISSFSIRGFSLSLNFMLPQILKFWFVVYTVQSTKPGNCSLRQLAVNNKWKLHILNIYYIFNYTSTWR